MSVHTAGPGVADRSPGHTRRCAMRPLQRITWSASAGLLRDCARRGMRAPVLAVGDGTLGF
ncbi:hypothetical protein ACFRQM_49260 [Streptomyces sp. NPDC056831]|uniref:hypothetical protein n=1 Tax=Streptomyces sp. NPDC056831 TaxID=3345954 RepID=UPI003689E75B